MGASIAVLALGIPQAFAQTAHPPASPPVPEAAAPPSEDDADSEFPDIVVEGRRSYFQQVGAVVGNIEPELQLKPADIQSYGVSTLSGLLEELAPETRSERGRGGELPVFLLNGRRISGRNEVLTLPTEAILRVDILPEEVALKYGYAADQRVINIVLRRRFRAVVAELQGGGPTEGGEVTGEGDADLIRIRRDNRLNLDVKYQGWSGLTENSRGIVQPHASLTSGADRSLIPATQTLGANAVLARPMAGGINATVNATLTGNTADSLLGRPAIDAAGFAFGPRHRTVNTWSAHLGSTLNKDHGEWRFSFTGAYDHGDSQTATDTVFAGISGGAGPSIAQNHARSITDSGNVQLLANGPLLSTPAGPLYLSAKAGDTQSRLSADGSRGTNRFAAALSRNDGNVQLNLDLPLTSRRYAVLPGLGDLSVNANGSIDRLSDFGTLRTYGYGLIWTPLPGYTLGISRSKDQAAPTIQQLGAATVFTPGVRVFDYVTGRTVDVTQITGGSPGLRSDARDVLKIGLTMKPIETRDLTVTANYVKIRNDRPIQDLPAATPAVQADFAERFLRDPTGEFVEEDLRPVNFVRSDRSELRWGVNYSQRIGPAPADPGPGFSAAVLQAARDNSMAGAAAARRRRGAAATADGRLQFGIYHTLYHVDREQLSPGSPTLDLLNGAAAAKIGGQYRNEVEAKLGIAQQGFGARLAVNWREGTSVRGASASPAGDLRFSHITTINLHLFANLGQQKELVVSHPWLKGVRVGIYVKNLLDQRIRVLDVNDATPIAYQLGYIDPTGRTVMLTVRKQF